MGFFIFKFIFKPVIKLIISLVPWIFRYLYHYLLLSNSSIHNEQIDEDGLNELKHIAPISPMLMTRETAKESFKEIHLPEVANAQLPRPLVVEKRKPSFSIRRKLFKNGLLLHALMQQKHHIM